MKETSGIVQTASINKINPRKNLLFLQDSLLKVQEIQIQNT